MNYNVGTTVIGKDVYINGEKLPSPPIKSDYVNVTTIDGQVFINGFEWKNGEWKRTAKALWHLWF